MLGCIAYMPFMEEGLNRAVEFLQGAEAPEDGGLELVWPGEGPPAHLGLQRIPDQLVGVEFGRIGGEGKEAQAPVGRLDESLHRRGPMGRVPIDDEEDGARRLVEEALQEGTELRARHPAGNHHEPEASPWTNGRDEVEPKPRSRRSNHWGLPHGSPGGAGVGIRSHAGLVSEIEGGACPFGQGPDIRVLCHQPALHRRRVLLVGPVEGALGAQAEFLQETSHGHLAQPDPEPVPDQVADHRTGPEGELELELQWGLLHDRPVQPGQLLPLQPRRPAGDRLGSEGIEAALPGLREPFVDPAPGKAQRADDRFRALSRFHALHGPNAEFFQCLVAEAAPVGCSHNTSIAYVRLLMQALVFGFRGMFVIVIRNYPIKRYCFGTNQ